ncbi:COG4315 family predicted lipoprotein [Marinibacterium profundimaris]|uniref:Lipoprotein n=1 Tax=Marinibacterium profundimaris TaxID=1679460 RepID=A0A225NBL8_9RHOB|nr:hypothetical protein [Marinibacterium profundimaris]OWU68095.1 hypothetical protein ATO3_24665 [Marinibacterium profundimaris]
MVAHLSRFAGATAIVGLIASVGSADNGAATLSVGTSEEFGDYVVGPNGKPVYTFLTKRGASDGQDPLDSCNADCREEWPPLDAPGEVRASKELDAYLLGTTKDEDGEPVVSYAGQPLFSFYRDAAGDEPSGQGIYSFGGYWALLNPSGVPIRSDAIPAPDTE